MKKLLKVLVVLLLLLVLVGAAGLLFVDQAVKAAVERGGTYALGVETELGSADVGILSGSFGMESLRIANPSGFQKPDFLTLANGRMELELDTVNKGTLVVPLLSLEGVTLDLERQGTDTNFGKILDNLERFESGEKESEPVPESEQMKLLIRKIVIRDVQVSVDAGTSIAGFSGTSFTIPEIVVSEVGTGGEGKSISEHFSTILRALLDEALEFGKGAIPPELLADLEGKLAELDGLKDGLGEEVQQQIDEALEDAQKGLDDETKKLGDDAQKKLKELGGGMQDMLKKKDGN